MTTNLRRELAKLSDEEFYELSLNMEAAITLRKIIDQFSTTEIATELTLPLAAIDDILVGAFELTTRHLGIIQRLEKEYDDLMDDLDDNDDPEEPSEEEIRILDDIENQEENETDDYNELPFPLPLPNGKMYVQPALFNGGNEGNQQPGYIDRKDSYPVTDNRGNTHYPPVYSTPKPDQEFYNQMEKDRKDYLEQQTKIAEQAEQKESSEKITDSFAGI
jgi:hypothetical protein